MSFSEGMRSAAVKRISGVSGLHTTRFAEDSGSLAHPIRPHFYQTINNLYTAIVYHKGSEVIRMLRTLCGREGFCRETDIHFKLNDGQAMTCVHWVKAIHDANLDAFNIEKFSRWYSQAGTPKVTVISVHDARRKTLTLHISQIVPHTHEQSTKLPATIPVTTGLIGPDGSVVAMDLGDGTEPTQERVLVFSEQAQSFILHNVPAGTLTYMLRNFSAPIKLKYLTLQLIVDGVHAKTEDFPTILPVAVEAFKRTLIDESIDAALRAKLFYLPSESYILDHVGCADPIRIRAVRTHIRHALAIELEREFRTVINSAPMSHEYSLDVRAQGGRALRNVALSHLYTQGDDDVLKRALTQ
eukprot:IDg2032t1